jgi:CheY-like chemotaxis protein
MKTTRRKILIVEDDKWFLDMYSKLLSDAGFEVIQAANAYKAIDLVAEGTIPDAIILDLFLPGVNGFALIHELQTYEDTREIPVVVCTTVADSIGKKNSLPQGITKLLDKSTMEPKDIVYAMQGLLNE